MANDPADAITLWEALKFLAPLVGGGGLTAIGVAYFGSKRPAADSPRLAQSPPPPAPAPVQIQVETPWLMQQIFEMKNDVENTGNKVDALVKAVGDLSVQVNTMAAIGKRRQQRE